MFQPSVSNKQVAVLIHFVIFSLNPFCIFFSFLCLLYSVNRDVIKLRYADLSTYICHACRCVTAVEGEAAL